MSCSDRWSARIDRALCGRAGRWAWRRLRAHLATCAACRADYDRGAAALAVLEGAAPEGLRAHLEADLFAALGTPEKPAWRWFPIGAATLAAAAAVAFVLRSPAPEPPSSLPPSFQARGAVAGLDVGFRLFCIRTDGGDASIRDAATSAGSQPAQCAIGDRLQFTWSAPREVRHLALFSVGPRGDVVWYWPRTAGASPIAGGTDQPLPGSFDLRARHGPGRHHVFGIFSIDPVPRYAVERLLGWVTHMVPTPTLPETLPFPGKVVDAWLELR